MDITIKGTATLEGMKEILRLINFYENSSDGHEELEMETEIEGRVYGNYVDFEYTINCEAAVVTIGE